MSAEATFVRRRLDSIAQVGGGLALGRSVSEGGSLELPYLRVANVQDGHIDTTDMKTVRVFSEEIERYRVKEGDLLLTEGGDFDKLGRGAVWDGRIPVCLHQNHVFKVRVDRGVVLPEYLSLYMGSRRGRRYFLNVAKQTTNLASISSSQLKAMPIYFPSLEVQRRVIDIMDAFQGRIEAEREEVAKQDRLWDGILNRELEQQRERYGSSRLCDVSRGVAAYGSNSPASPHRVDMPRYVRITDIDERGFLSPVESGAASIPLASARRYLLKDGDLLIARTGFTTGKSYLYRPSDGLCAFAGYLVRFQIDSRKMLPDYAFLWTTGNRFREWISRNVREVGQRNISAREYDEHEIAHPPLSVQQDLVDAAQSAREIRRLQMMEIHRLYTLRSALADDLLEGRVNLQCTL